MSGETGTIGMNGFDPLNISTWLPIFGYWCGPNWSAGQRNSLLSRDDLVKAAVQSTVGPDGVPRASPVDSACKQHDLDYYDAALSPNLATLTYAADSRLMTTLANLDLGSFDLTLTLPLPSIPI